MAVDNKILQSSSRSIYYSIAVQILFRATSFLMNIVLLRYISKDLLGLINVRLLLLYSTIFTLSTEPCLRTCLSRDQHSKTITQSTINTLWLSVPISFLWCCMCGVVWLTCFDWPGETITEKYTTSVIFYSISAFIEVLAEPLRTMSQILLLVKVKPFIEGLSLTIETVVVVGCVVWQPQLGVMAFCVARLIHSACAAGCYYGYFIYRIRIKNINKKNDQDDDFQFTSLNQLLPSESTTSIHMPSPSSSSPTPSPINHTPLLWSFSKQVMLKQMLTEGEKYIMTIFGLLSFEDQGIYSLVSNLGSMVVRILMLPMEEGFYLFVSRSLPRGGNIRKEEGLNKQEKEKVSKIHIEEVTKHHFEDKDENYETIKGNITQVSDGLEVMLKLRFIFGVVLSTFGYSTSFMVLDILFGSQVSSPPGPSLLRITSIYLLFVSLNGILEAFLNASMSHEELNRHNKFMVFFSFSFLFSCFVLIRLLPFILPPSLAFLTPSSSASFILSNCVVMLLRIFYSCIHIHKYFSKFNLHPLNSLIISPTIAITFIIILAITIASEHFFISDFKDINTIKHSLLNNDNKSINTGMYVKLVPYVSHSVVVGMCLLVALIVLFVKENKIIKFVRKNYIKKKTN